MCVLSRLYKTDSFHFVNVRRKMYENVHQQCKMRFLFIIFVPKAYNLNCCCNHEHNTYIYIYYNKLHYHGPQKGLKDCFFTSRKMKSSNNLLCLYIRQNNKEKCDSIVVSP